MDSSRSDFLSSGRKESARLGKEDKSPRSDAKEAMSTSRTDPATDRGMETYRTSMSTARVHTALAALTAEKQGLMVKLAQIDAALETGDKKRMSKPRATYK